jgi:S-adenosylmethionine:diacylglycerol 3-amino-3-carboxypropyl transferase
MELESAAVVATAAAVVVVRGVAEAIKLHLRLTLTLLHQWLHLQSLSRWRAIMRAGGRRQHLTDPLLAAHWRANGEAWWQATNFEGAVIAVAAALAVEQGKKRLRRLLRLKLHRLLLR